MATVTGTNDDDFIHRAGDGRTPPAGFNEVTGVTAAADSIRGGSGDDIIYGDGGNDTIVGGAGADTMFGEEGDDQAFINTATTGADSIDLGAGSDIVNISGRATEMRLTFTSAEVGNGSANDSGGLANQDGGLAARLQAEDDAGALVGGVTRVDDEGVTFVGGAGITFDVRDLVSGVARGNQFQVVTLGTVAAESLSAIDAASAIYINAGQGNDTVTGGTGNDFLVGGAGDDSLLGSAGNDSFIGGGGTDVILGGAGNDTAILNVSTDGGDRINLDTGSDIVNVNADAATNVRLTFTSAEVGNGSPVDSGALANQDGGVAVRLNAEDAAGDPTGTLSRVDDEGVTFVGGAGVTFDVRDLVSGAARGEEFEVVTLGTAAAETLNAVQATRSYYINGGQGNDTINGGRADDFLVGGAGNDRLSGGRGDDSFIGGGGDDVIIGGPGENVVTQNVTTDGADRVNLGTGDDLVNVNADAATNVRLTFTSAEIGNGSGVDSGTLANQDGGLALRLQAESAAGVLGGPISRYDDEGVTFVGGAGVTFDVRDLVSGVARGEEFEVVTLGTSAADRLEAVQEARPYYINAGQGDDIVSGGSADDFLVGGAGGDYLFGADGADSLLGGAGNDTLRGGDGNDTAIFNISTDGADRVNLDGGSDFVNVSAAAAGQVRLTFTSAEVGNGSALDSGALANQDGLIALRMQAENASGGLTGEVSRFDDEGITFVSSTPGVTFDVRDLVSGIARGDGFEVVTLGTSAGESLSAVEAARPYYINAGGGDDVVFGGSNRDFLVGGAGADRLDGDSGHDSLLGGGGADVFAFSAPIGAGANNIDTIVDFSVADDTVELNTNAFANIGAGPLTADAFTIGSVATDAEDRVIYDSVGGRLLYDQDGSGTAFGAVRFANITTGLALTNDDFTVV